MLTRGTWLDAIPCLFSLRPQEVCPLFAVKGNWQVLGLSKTALHVLKSSGLASACLPRPLVDCVTLGASSNL